MLKIRDEAACTVSRINNHGPKSSPRAVGQTWATARSMRACLVCLRPGLDPCEVEAVNSFWVLLAWYKGIAY